MVFQGAVEEVDDAASTEHWENIQVGEWGWVGLGWVVIVGTDDNPPFLLRCCAH